MIRIEIPGTPVPKSRPRAAVIAGRARLFTPAPTRSFEAAVAWIARQAMGDAQPFDEALSVEIRVHLTPPASWSAKQRALALAGRRWPTSRPDVDNLGKSVCDGCNGIVWTDDSRIVELSVSKTYAASAGVVVDVRPVSS